MNIKSIGAAALAASTAAPVAAPASAPDSESEDALDSVVNGLASASETGGTRQLSLKLRRRVQSLGVTSKTPMLSSSRSTVNSKKLRHGVQSLGS